MSVSFAEDTPEQARFRALLDECREEQAYQSFLENNTRFLPREFEQNHGIHLSLVLRKLPLAENLVTDFCYLSKSSMDWNCVFVEIEKPSSRYFSANRRLHSDFRQALEQIDEWRSWLNVDGNRQHLLQETLSPLLVPASMRRNPVYFKYVLVLGRRAEYENQERQRLIQVKEKLDFKIVSYDTLLESPDRLEVYVGERKTDRIDIITDHFVDDNLFAYVPPNQLRVKNALKCDAAQRRDRWTLTVADNEIVSRSDVVLPDLKTID